MLIAVTISLLISSSSAQETINQVDPVSQSETTGTVCVDCADTGHSGAQRAQKTVNEIRQKSAPQPNICHLPGNPYFMAGSDVGEDQQLKVSEGKVAVPTLSSTIEVEFAGHVDSKSHPMCDGVVLPDANNELVSCGNPAAPIGRRMTTLMDISRRSRQHPNFQPVCTKLRKYFEDTCSPAIGNTKDDRIEKIKSLITPAMDRYPGQGDFGLDHLAFPKPKTTEERAANLHARESVILCLMQHENPEFIPIKTSNLTCKEAGHSDFGLGQLVRASVVDIVDRASAMTRLKWPDEPNWQSDTGQPLNLKTGLDVYNHLGENISLQIQVIALFLQYKWPVGGSIRSALERYHGEKSPAANTRYANTIMNCYDKLMSRSPKSPGVFMDAKLTDPEKDKRAVDVLSMSDGVN